MKRLLSLIIITIFAVSAFAQSGQKQLNPVGSWKFEAPSAPEGYTSGIISVSVTEKQHAASISFTGSEYKIPAEKVKLSGDSLMFSVYLEGESINMRLRMVPDNRMTGKAIYSEGEVPLTLTRLPAQQK